MMAFAYFLNDSGNTGETATANLFPMAAAQLANNPSDYNPATQGAYVADWLNALPEGHRWMFPTKMCQDLHNTSPVAPATAIDLFINGYNVGPYRDRARVFFQAVKDNIDDGVTVDYLGLNELEIQHAWTKYNYDGLGATWSDKATVAYGVISHPIASRRLSPRTRAITLSDLQTLNNTTASNDSDVTRATADWNAVVGQICAQAIRDVCVASFVDVFGYLPRVSNDGENNTRLGWARYPFGPPISPLQTAVGGRNGGTIYMSTTISVSGSHTKPNWWNNLIWHLNMIRLSTGPAEWRIASPGYHGDGQPKSSNFSLWHECLKHLGAMGYGEFVGFVPGWTPTEKSYMQDAIAALDVRSSLLVPRALIPYDADSITTNGYTTNYSSGLAP